MNSKDFDIDYSDSVDWDATLLLSGMREEDFEGLYGLGMMSSAKYRKRFLTVAKAAGALHLFPKLILMSVVVKNKQRILNVLASLNKSWAKDLKEFVEKHTVQYTVEAAENNISIVHLPSAFPMLATFFWCKIVPETHFSVDEFLKNSWASQMNMSTELKKKQKAHEMKFWDEVVKSTKNSKSTAKKEDFCFREAFWDTKAKDTYNFLGYDKTVSSEAALFEVLKNQRFSGREEREDDSEEEAAAAASAAPFKPPVSKVSSKQEVKSSRKTPKQKTEKKDKEPERSTESLEIEQGNDAVRVILAADKMGKSELDSLLAVAEPAIRMLTEEKNKEFAQKVSILKAGEK